MNLSHFPGACFDRLDVTQILAGATSLAFKREFWLCWEHSPDFGKILYKRSTPMKYWNFRFSFPLTISHCVLCSGVQKLLLGCSYSPALLLEVFLLRNCSKTVSQIGIVRGSIFFFFFFWWRARYRSCFLLQTEMLTGALLKVPGLDFFFGLNNCPRVVQGECHTTQWITRKQTNSWNALLN